jgi:hypothetical protein
MVRYRVSAAPSPHPSPRRGEGDDVSLTPGLRERPSRFPPLAPTGRGCPKGG